VLFVPTVCYCLRDEEKHVLSGLLPPPLSLSLSHSPLPPYPCIQNYWFSPPPPLPPILLFSLYLAPSFGAPIPLLGAI